MPRDGDMSILFHLSDRSMRGHQLSVVQLPLLVLSLRPPNRTKGLGGTPLISSKWKDSVALVKTLFSNKTQPTFADYLKQHHKTYQEQNTQLFKTPRKLRRSAGFWHPAVFLFLFVMVPLLSFYDLHIETTEPRHEIFSIVFSPLARTPKVVVRQFRRIHGLQRCNVCCMTHCVSPPIFAANTGFPRV